MDVDGNLGFGVYVHVPFCRSKCRYCDFNSYPDRLALAPRYVQAVLREMAVTASQLVGGRARTLYFGGGTPSLLAAAQIAAVIRQCREGLRLAEDAEVTLEANPGTVDLAYLAALREAGVNRLSLGVQSFAEKGLRFLGRNHSGGEAMAAYAAARQAGFDNVSLDLIYALPGQTVAEWLADLRQAIDLAPEHLSLYALSIEEGTPLAALVASGQVVPASGDEAASKYEAAAALLAHAGYEHYEVSNWARAGRPGRQAACCRHNLGYWRNEPYLGFGAGAHSFFAGRRYRNEPEPARYVALVEAQDGAVVEATPIDARRAAADTVMLGLRLAEGIDCDRFAARHGLDLATLCEPELAELAALGLARRDERAIALTPRGWLVANEVIVRLLTKLQAV